MCSLVYCLFSVLILCVYFTVACAQSLRLQNRIIGGSSAVKKQFPFQVSLRYKNINRHFCGGSIITDQFILTAGHCLIYPNVNKDLIYGILNMTYFGDQGIRVDFVASSINHLYEVTRVRSDIALLRTKDKITFSQFVQPIDLPNQDYIEPGTPAFVSGWGRVQVLFFDLI